MWGTIILGVLPIHPAVRRKINRMERSPKKDSEKFMGMPVSLNSSVDMEDLPVNLSRLEERLLSQTVGDVSFCIWVTCPNVCPPDGYGGNPATHGADGG